MPPIADGGVFESGELLKPRSDKRQFRCIRLENELQALLISDAETDKGAAAMAVNVGSFSDPEDIPGLAHFLEHMLFYASAKYPVEDSYATFLNEHGGSSNAYTSSEHTNYHLDVSHEHLEEALDRFSQFFICPLLSADATNREMNAVDSENSKNLTVDVWRLHQLNKSLTAPSHPFHKFNVGNLETLGSGPKARGQDIREELLRLYDLYSASLMRLVVYGKNSLDELESTVRAKFSAIKSTGQKDIRFPGKPCDPVEEHLQVMIKAVPISDGHTLQLTWPVPPQLTQYRAGPSRYLGHLIGHEADGSLFAVLKARGWATSLCAGESEGSWEFAFFSVTIELTEEGQARLEEIVSLVFGYIAIVRDQGGVDKWRFDELHAVCEMEFHFQDKRQPFSYTSGLAANMLTYPQEDWLAADRLPREFNEDAIRAVLRELTPQNLRLVWTSKSFEAEATETEKWYGTKYNVTRLEPKLLEAWTNNPSMEGLHLPERNEFVATDFSLRVPSPDHEKVPVVVYVSPLARLWFKSDPNFRTPKAVITLDFACPPAYASPEAAVLTRLFTKLLVDDINEYAYYAEIAGLSYSIEATVLGFQVSVQGYSHKIRLLAQKIVDKIAEFRVREERFQDIKEKQLKDFENFKYDQPYQQAMYNASILLEYRRWHMSEYLTVLPGLEAQDLRNFVPHLLSRMFMECHVAGNLSVDESVNFIKQVETSLSPSTPAKPLADGNFRAAARPLFPSQLAERRVLMLQPGVKWLQPLPATNAAQDENSALVFYLQVGQDEPRLNMLAQLLVQTATREAFYQLRTVEQLGYIVYLVSRNDLGVRGIQCIVQSTVKSALALDARVEAFLEGFEQKLSVMGEEEFQVHANALAALKEERHKNLSEEVRAHWKEIDQGTLMFDRVEREVKELRKLSLPDVQQFFAQFVKRDGPQRRKVSFQVFGGPHLGALAKALGGSSDNTEVLVEKMTSSQTEETQSANGATVESTPKETVEASTVTTTTVAGEEGTLSDSEAKKDGELAQADGVVEEDVVEEIDAKWVIRDVYAFKRSQVMYGSLKGQPLSAL
eukprot:TRINITY_DN5550_c0_g1_i1.p1 TRINITY_DN5550_c0_g1~~TRINITY_DN5550_c0_g1_i1.p1  ORF type:complete len:1062 (+),score=215.89 TRINITY_DN5550_c0_g1_i1:412-3597(+)